MPVTYLAPTKCVSGQDVAKVDASFAGLLACGSCDMKQDGDCGVKCTSCNGNGWLVASTIYQRDAEGYLIYQCSYCAQQHTQLVCLDYQPR